MPANPTKDIDIGYISPKAVEQLQRLMEKHHRNRRMELEWIIAKAASEEGITDATT